MDSDDCRDFLANAVTFGDDCTDADEDAAAAADADTVTAKAASAGTAVTAACLITSPQQQLSNNGLPTKANRTNVKFEQMLNVAEDIGVPSGILQSILYFHSCKSANKLLAHLWRTDQKQGKLYLHKVHNT